MPDGSDFIKKLFARAGVKIGLAESPKTTGHREYIELLPSYRTPDLPRTYTPTPPRSDSPQDFPNLAARTVAEQTVATLPKEVRQGWNDYKVATLEARRWAASAALLDIDWEPGTTKAKQLHAQGWIFAWRVARKEAHLPVGEVRRTDGKGRPI